MIVLKLTTICNFLKHFTKYQKIRPTAIDNLNKNEIDLEF